MLDTRNLSRECEVFTSYLIKLVPNSYVIDKYRDAHLVTDLRLQHSERGFDKLLVSMASIHPFLTRMVDSYARIVCPATLARKKLILLMAILETCAPTHEKFDLWRQTRKGIAYMRIFENGATFLSNVALSILLLGPLHLVFLVKCMFVPRGK